MTEGDEKDRVLRKLSNAEYLIDQLKKRGAAFMAITTGIQTI